MPMRLLISSYLMLFAGNANQKNVKIDIPSFQTFEIFLFPIVVRLFTKTNRQCKKRIENATFSSTLVSVDNFRKSVHYLITPRCQN